MARNRQWLPGPLPEGRPFYRALADAIAGDVARGRLRPGDRLPPRRALAGALGVTVGTIARAYTEAESRGLVAAEVGRGTYVRSGFGLADTTASTCVDLASLHPPLGGGIDPAFLLGETLTALAGDPVALRAVATTEYGQDAPAHREAAAAWAAHGGWRPDPTHVLLTAGAQHALTVALLALASPGRAVATAQLTNPGLIAAARRLSIPVVAVDTDAEGILPDALARTCARKDVAVVHLEPTLANPTGRTMPPGRRAELADVCDRAGVWVIEEDALGPLATERPDPVAQLLPQRTLHVASAAKALALGLRVGVLTVPDAAFAELASTVRATTWLTPPLLAEVLARWVGDGTADLIVAARRTATAQRNTAAREILAGLDVITEPAAPHLWLPLPEPWTAGQFAAATREAGILVSPGDEYTPRREHAAFGVRIGLNADVEDEVLRDALLTLVHLLGSAPPPGALA
ncbi:PLP-dependent aminotransferase family protein [Streptomyces sp. NPDC001373]|uniref:aminotransferase-like domain-containing protein n=1 Tax=Streptomyces sp. NPDC001373 TaxID=3364565 RepID=UPI0036A06BA4